MAYCAAFRNQRHGVVVRTYSAKPKDVERAWLLIDAEDLVLGRLAVVIADRIRGKHKPIFTPHIDTGDHVVVINADKVKLTGHKESDKIYYRHTGYPGGIKARTVAQVREGKRPEALIRKAVQRMVPRGPLGRDQLRKLHVYGGAEHPHDAQKPDLLDVAALNPKNKRSV